MTAQDLSHVLQRLVSELKANDFAKAKTSIEALRQLGASDGGHEALIELANSGALDRLIADKDEIRARWLATQIITVARGDETTTRTDKKAAAHALALDLLKILMRTGATLDEELARRTLKALCEVRAFEALARLGDRFIALGLKDPMIPKLVAQGLIDSGYPRAGLAVLSEMLASTPHDHPDRLDGLGLAGRANKQVYVECGAPHAGGPSLRDAILKSAACYEDAYLAARKQLHPRFEEWSYPAINLVAVMTRAKKDGISAAVRTNPEELARQIASEFNNIPADKREIWDLGTAGEAAIALGDWPAAERLFQEYATQPAITAFQLGGTVRQLEEVWRLDLADPQQGRLLYFLKAQLLAKDGGHIIVSPAERAQLMSVGETAQLEVYLSDGRPKPVQWFQQGLERSNSVALVQQKSNKVGFGTGFLVRGGDFIAHLGDEPMLLTNAHVLSERASELNDPMVPSVRPTDAVVEFTQAGAQVRRRSFEIDRIIWDSPRSELDACLVALKAPPDDIPYCTLSKNQPKVNKSRVIVIGHPGGEREMKLSLYESPVIEFGPTGLFGEGGDTGRLFVRYTNPTIGGNSGSPVFDIDDWCVVALHHAGFKAQSAGGPAGGPGGANEGVFIGSIVEANSPRTRSAAAPAVARAPAAGARLQSVAESASAPVDRSRAAPGTGKLVHDIPIQMFEGHTVTVTANISRVESEKLFAGLSRGASDIHNIVPTAAMTVVLRSPQGAFEIVPLTSETQWIDRRGAALDAVTAWKWSVKPIKPGAHRLSLVLQGREALDGVEAALPATEQIIPVRVRVNKSARAINITKWAAVAAAGGMLSWLGQMFMRSFT